MKNPELKISFKKFLINPFILLTSFFNNKGYMVINLGANKNALILVSNSIPEFSFLKSKFNFITKVSIEETAQVIVEYFVLLTIIIALTIVGTSTFFPKIQASFNAMQQAAVNEVVHADGN